MRREAALMQNMTAPNWASRWMEGGGHEEEGGNFPENPLGPQLGSKRSKTIRVLGRNTRTVP